MSFKARMLIKLRNFVWEIRKNWDRDRFERERDMYLCERISLHKFLGYVEEFDSEFQTFIGILENIEYGTGKPEIDCLLQYEEEGQLCSLHWYLDDKTQLHLRIFKPTDDVSLYMSDIELRAHIEIRPDYDPMAHIRGDGLRGGCETLRSILAKAQTLKYK